MQAINSKADGAPIILVFGQSNAGLLNSSGGLQDALNELDDDAQVVSVAMGGTSVSKPDGAWNIVVGDGADDVGPLYTQLLEDIATFKAQTPDAYVAGAVWVHGESDRNVDRDYYEPTKLLFEQMQADIGEEFPIIVVGLSDLQNGSENAGHKHVLDAQMRLAEDLDYAHFLDVNSIIEESGLTPSEIMRDGLHYNEDFYDRIADSILEQPVIQAALGLDDDHNNGEVEEENGRGNDEMEEEHGHGHGEDAALALAPVHDATHVAVNSGSWFSPSTWSDGVVPDDDAQVYIPHGLSVAYDGVSDARIFTLRADGDLSFATDTDSRLVVDTMIIHEMGSLTIGTQDAPVEDGVTAEIIIANNGDIDVAWDPALLSRGVLAMGEVEIHGQEKTTHLKVDSDPAAGDTSISFAQSPEGWQVGDTIVIAGTYYEGHAWNQAERAVTHHEPQDEVRVITAIEDGVVSFDEPLLYDHATPRDDLKTSVANYTRNVVIATENPETAETHHRGHVMFRHTDDVDVRYAEFFELGRTDKSTTALNPSEFETIASDSNVKGRYAFHFHMTGFDDVENPGVALGNAVYGSPGWGFVHHSSNAILHDNATYDTFGAGFVAESGDEIGSWTNNIAIYAEGQNWAIPKNGNDLANFDLGQTGDGFWFQGRMVEAHDNIAASVNTGFVYFHRGRATNDELDGQTAFNPEVFELPEALGYGRDANPDDAPILHFTGNEAFAAKEGIHVVKANTAQNHDVHTHLQDFTAWSVVTGAHFEYTSHYIVEDFDVIARETAPFRDSRYGIQLGPNISDFTIINPTIQGFDRAGLNLQKHFTGEGRSPEQHQYVIIDPTFIDIEEEYLNYDPTLDRIISSEELNERFEIALEGPLTFSAAVGARNVAINGVKIDTIGEIKLPAGIDDYDITFRDVIAILERDGYYEGPDGKNYFVLESYYRDRFTAEIHKRGHLVELDEDVPLGNQFFSFADAKFNGPISFDNEAPTADEPILAETRAGADITFNLLAGVSDAEGDDLKIDGIVQPPHGQVFDNGDGTVTYRPDFDFSGQERFKYWISDGQGNFTPAWADVVVAPESADAQPISFVGTAADETILGNELGDALSGAGGDDTLYGLEGADTLDGGAGDDIINAGGGDDEIIESLGADSIDGGDGVDSYIAAADAAEGFSINARVGRADTGFGEVAQISGVERFVGSSHADKLIGASGAEIALGGAGDDTLQGAGGDDSLEGGLGADLLSGAAGDDTLIGDEGADRVNAGIGADVVNVGEGDDRASGGGGQDVLYGGDGADTLNSGLGADTIWGEDGDDRLLGGGGDDLIIGGAGDDFIRGQAGVDRYVYTEAAFGQDTIKAYNDKQDVFVVAASTGASSFADVDVQQTGEDVTISFGSGSIVLEKRFATQIDESDFEFVSDINDVIV